MKKILIITPYYLPSNIAGGPVQSIKNIVKRLSRQFSFFVITPNSDLDGTKYLNIKEDDWNIIENTNVYYVSDYGKMIKYIFQKKSEYDLIYLNSFFSFKYSIIIVLLNFLKIINKIIVLAPRGEFAESALDIKAKKKKFFFNLVKRFGIYKNIIFQATSIDEKKDISLEFSNNEIFLVNNLTSMDIIENYRERKICKNINELYIVTVARIVDIKNLSFSLEILQNISLKYKIFFDIYGPIEDENYWCICQDIIRSLPQNISVKYRGKLDNKDVLTTVSKYHLYMLPTKGENFGHSIVESMKAVTPILISDKTPWRNLENIGIGWDISLSNKEGYKTIIEMLSNMTHEDFLSIYKKVYIYIKNNLESKDIEEDYEKLFKYEKRQ